MALQQKGERECKSCQVCAGEAFSRFLLANLLLDECTRWEPFCSAGEEHYFKRIHCQEIQGSISLGCIKAMFLPFSWVLFTEFCEVPFPRGFRHTFMRHHADMRHLNSITALYLMRIKQFQPLKTASVLQLSEHAQPWTITLAKEYWFSTKGGHLR